MRWTEANAAALAKIGHRGQYDKLGRDYYLAHIVPIATAIERAGGHREDLVVAYLHDFVEDYAEGREAAIGVLTALAIPEELLLDILAVTHERNEPLEHYIERVKSRRRSWYVKEFDVRKNDNPADRRQMTEETSTRLAEKYRRSRELLGMPDYWSDNQVSKPVRKTA